jgi:hypothetical protein
MPDGTESFHIMGEGSLSPEAEKLKTWLAGREATICCGHYHGQSILQTSYGTVLLEGRGGAQGYAGHPVCGYTVVYIQPEGWTAHSVTL